MKVEGLKEIFGVPGLSYVKVVLLTKTARVSAVSRHFEPFICTRFVLDDLKHAVIKIFYILAGKIIDRKRPLTHIWDRETEKNIVKKADKDLQIIMIRVLKNNK